MKTVVLLLAVLSAWSMEPTTAVQDKDAVTAFKTSISKIETLIAAKTVAAQEGQLLLRAMETASRMAALQFRIVHEGGSTNSATAEREDYKTTLNKIVDWSNRYRKQFGNGNDLPRVIYLAAKAKQELGQTDLALADLRTLLDSYPDNPDRLNALLSLNDLFGKESRYDEALLYLKKFRVTPNEAHYPVIMDRIAFANFYTNRIPEALQHMELKLRALPTGTANAGKGELVERESTLNNMALFYFTGTAAKDARYAVAGALPYFLKLQPGPIIEKMLTYFAKLLRIKGMDAPLESFKRTVAQSQLDPRIKIETIFVAAENELNKKLFRELHESMAELQQEGMKIKLQAETTRKLSALSSSIQTAFKANEKTPLRDIIADSLISSYMIMLQTSPDLNVTVGIRYNLAEIHVILGQLEAATEHYRWIVEKGTQANKSQALVKASAQKAIAIRFQILKGKKFFPDNLRPVGIAADKKPTKELAPAAKEWISWVDAAATEKDSRDYEAYLYEADRLLYATGEIEKAISRITSWTRANPASQYFVPATSLVLDTLIASSRWEDTYRLANEYLRLMKPDNAPYRQKLLDLAADSHFKISEAAYRNGDFKQVIERAEELKRLYPTTHRLDDVNALAANAALAMKDKKLAATYFTSLRKSGKKPELLVTGLLTEASLSEENYDIERALSSYRSYLALPEAFKGMNETQIDSLKHNILTLAWISGKPGTLRTFANTPILCTGKMAQECDRFRALAIFGGAEGLIDRTRAREAAKKSSSGTNAIFWQLVALSKADAWSTQERIDLLARTSSLWEGLDPPGQAAALPFVTERVVSNLALLPTEISKATPIRLDKKAISRRAAMIEKAEKALQTLSAMPLAGIRVTALKEWSGLYQDLADKLRTVAPPAGLSGDDLKTFIATIDDLTAPFIDKARELRKRALETGSQSGVESGVMAALGKATLAADPKTAAELRLKELALDSVPPNLLPDDVVASLNYSNNPPCSVLKTESVSAQKAKNWPLLAYLSDDARDKKCITNEERALVNALFLSHSLAQAEALAASEPVMAALPKPLRLKALTYHAIAWAGALNAVKAKLSIDQWAEAASEPDRKTAALAPFRKMILQAAKRAGAQSAPSLGKEWGL